MSINPSAAIDAVPPAGVRPLEVQLRDGRRVTLRTVRPDDAQRMQAALRGMSAQSRYARFMSALRELTPQMLDRATRPDAGRELQLVAVDGDGAQQTIVGGARYAAAPGSRDCEFALAVVDDWQGQGLARQLLETLMRVARARGFERMEGYILASNARMLGLAKRLGFAEVESPEGPGICLVRCDLGGTLE
jgi:GNAT superfamily N-acetyltransferase